MNQKLEIPVNPSHTQFRISHHGKLSHVNKTNQYLMFMCDIKLGFF